MTANLDVIFEALASSPRRQILAYLAEAQLSTLELAERFSMSSPAISRHLSILERADLVKSERRGQFVFYTLNAQSLPSTLASYALELCPIGRPLKKESRAIAATQTTSHTPSRSKESLVNEGSVNALKENKSTPPKKVKEKLLKD